MKPSRFRFRAWVAGERMVEFDLRSIYCAHILGHNVPEDAPLMQSTGLADESGREIFEGDVVRFDDPAEPCIKLHPIYSVEWDEVGWSLNSTTEPPTCIDADRLIVIGNIYENPELLG